MEQNYKNYLSYIINNGVLKEDRTGVGTISIFGYTMRFDLKRAFPAFTEKKLAFKTMVGELIWFLRGSTDENELREITYGRKSKESIWAANASASYWKDKQRFDGDCGKIYGHQWRHWEGYDIIGAQLPETVLAHDGSIDDGRTLLLAKPYYIDQLVNLVDTLKNKPDDRRMIISAWNVNDIEEGQMSLPPCHAFVQFWTRETNGKRYLSAQLYQRSCDSFLGVPFNVASYALLVHILAAYLDYEVDEFIWTGGDCHIYSNHIDQVKELLNTPTLEMPQLKINRDLSVFKNINSLVNAIKVDDFELDGYEFSTKLSGEMAV